MKSAGRRSTPISMQFAPEIRMILNAVRRHCAQGGAAGGRSASSFPDAGRSSRTGAVGYFAAFQRTTSASIPHVRWTEPFRAKVRALCRPPSGTCSFPYSQHDSATRSLPPSCERGLAANRAMALQRKKIRSHGPSRGKNRASPWLYSMALATKARTSRSSLRGPASSALLLAERGSLGSRLHRGTRPASGTATPRWPKRRGGATRIRRRPGPTRNAGQGRCAQRFVESPCPEIVPAGSPWPITSCFPGRA
jgi:hypothetical protein